MMPAAWFLGVLLLLTGSSRGSLGAQPKGAKAAPPTDRCLLIVETSKSMQRRSDGVLGAVRGLLMSGLNGQFREGGTLGVWTYNEDLYAGRFPLQTWSFAAQKDITQRTLAFLKSQKYQKEANFHKVAPLLSSVIKDSELITVILISTGDHEVRGTGFDDRINTAYRRWSSQQQEARMPFVTVLRARRGQIAGCTVNTPPWPVEMPRLPEETNQAAVVQAKLTEALRKPQTSSVPPLIVSGKKLQAEQASKPKPEPAAPKPTAPPTVAALAATNEAVAVMPPDKASPPPEPPKAEPAPALSTQPVPETSQKPVPEQAAVSAPKTSDVKGPETKMVEAPPAKLEVGSPLPAPKPKPESATVEQPKAPPVPEVKGQPAPIPPLTNAAAPAPVTVAPAAAPVVVAAEPTNAGAASLAPPRASRPAPPPQSGTATPTGSLLPKRTIWIGAALLAVVLFGVGVLLLRRARTAPQGSLITRSLEREKEP
jgi:hypothetical protein